MSNPHVGEKINGWTLLDRDTFERAIVAPMAAAIRALPDTVDPGISTNTYEFGAFFFNRAAGQFGFNIGDSYPFPGLYTGGRATFALPFDLDPYVMVTGYIDMESGQREIIGLNLAVAKGLMLNKLGQETTVFLFDGEQGTGPRERIQVAYRRYKDVVVSLAVKPYYSPSGWVSARSGVIFVATALASAVYAAGAVEAAGAASTGATQGFTQVVSTYGQLSGDKNLGAIAKVISAVSGQVGDTATPGITSTLDAQTAGAPEMGFFDNSFDGFNFSSGESQVAFSDAQNVNFGFGTTWSQPDSYVIPNEDFFGSDVYDFGAGTGGEYNFGTTPEVDTNVFGTEFDPKFGGGDVMTAANGVKIAQTGAAIQKQTTGNKASSGATGAKQSTGVGDALSGFGGFLSGVVNTAKSISGVAAQVTSTQPKTYTGQLKPGGGVTPAGVSQTSMLIVAGVALAVGAYVLFRKG